MRIVFIVLSGGTGSRMGLDAPKQFLEIAGEPVLRHSFRTFIKWRPDARFLCVAHPEHVNRSADLLSKLVEEFGVQIETVPGGETRHASSIAGLTAVKDAGDEDLIFLHDAARPHIVREELERLSDAFMDNKVEIASLVSPITDTVVRGTPLPGVVIERLNREELFAVKTPQVLRASALKKLLLLEESPAFTDLLSWGAAAGISGHTVLSGQNNIKLTGPGDIPMIRAIMEQL